MATAEVLFLLAILWCLFWLLAATRSRWFVLGVVALGAMHWVLAARGSYTDPNAFPPPQMLLLAPILLALLATLLLPRGRAWLRAMPLFALTAVHVLRLPVELVLHDAYQAGLVPQDMTYSGFNFDIFSGISALLLLLWMRSGRPPSRAVLLAWNVVCLCLLFVVVGTAVLSIPSTVQRFNFDTPLLLVLDPPWVLLPTVLVPAVLLAHVAALLQLLGTRVAREKTSGVA